MTTEMIAAAPGGETSPVGSSDQIALSETDRSRLSMFIHSGQQSARARTRAQVLLKLGEGWSLAEVCRAFDVCRNTVLNVRALRRGRGRCGAVP
jgi:DNA-directed RNA polymerase specialized sigma24 family protein